MALPWRYHGLPWPTMAYHGLPCPTTAHCGPYIAASAGTAREQVEVHVQPGSVVLKVLLPTAGAAQQLVDHISAGSLKYLNGEKIQKAVLGHAVQTVLLKLSLPSSAASHLLHQWESGTLKAVANHQVLEVKQAVGLSSLVPKSL